MREISREQVLRALRYEPISGRLYWRESNCRRKAGEVAGNVGPRGYVTVGIGGRLVLAHRLIWLMVHGEMPVEMDHLNGDRADNRIVNIRPATHTMNMENRRTASSNNRSGLLGVSWGARQRRWYARITTGGKIRHLGYFDSPEAAHEAYVKAKHKLHAGCSLPNFEALDAAMNHRRE